MNMRRQGLVWLAAGVVALSAAACFSDPTKSLRAGPTRLVLSTSFANMTVAETLLVTVQVTDDQGNFQSFAEPTYTPASATVAAMASIPDTTIVSIPGLTLWKSNLVGKAVGNTKVMIVAGGVTDSILVKVQ